MMFMKKYDNADHDKWMCMLIQKSMFINSHMQVDTALTDFRYIDILDWVVRIHYTNDIV